MYLGWDISWKQPEQDLLPTVADDENACSLHLLHRYNITTPNLGRNLCLA